MGTHAELLEQAYRDWSPQSERRAEEAARYMPGGDTRASAFFAPYPLFMQKGRGCRLVDVDGHEFIDFMNNFTSLIHGHAHPDVVEAVEGQVRVGSAYAAATDSQVDLAKLLCERVPSIDEMRFTSSGSEATNMCLRAARAFTGKTAIVKVEGGYHGSHEIGEMSLIPFPGKAGPPDRPTTLPPDRSINGSEVLDVITIPYNEPEIARRILEEEADRVAALIVEPVMGSWGMLPAEEGYLAALRELTLETEVLLIFDEVITLRLGDLGYQQRAGVTPDLCSMGKIIGGGLPIGAFGGRRDIIELFNPLRQGTVMHASTFSGNPLSMAAGLAAMRALPSAELARVDALGERLRQGIGQVFGAAGVRGGATGVGSLTGVHLGVEAPRNPREVLQGYFESGDMFRLLHLTLLRHGVFASSRGMLCTSTAMTEAEIDAAVSAFAAALEELKPAIEEDCSTLLL